MFVSVAKKILVTFCVVLLFSQQAHASPERAKLFIEESGNKILEILNNNNITTEEKEHGLAKIFDETVDVSWISRFSLGRHWNRASEKQKTEYIRLNHALLFKKYLPEIKEFNLQDLEFRKTSDLGDKEYMVRTRVFSPDETFSDVDYKVRKKSNGDFVVFDVMYDGLSLINTQRLEFSSIINRKGIDYLIYKLSVRTASVQKYLASMDY